MVRALPAPPFQGGSKKRQLFWRGYAGLSNHRFTHAENFREIFDPPLRGRVKMLRAIPTSLAREGGGGSIPLPPLYPTGFLALNACASVPSSR